jgi:hypothetical protein
MLTERAAKWGGDGRKVPVVGGNEEGIEARKLRPIPAAFPQPNRGKNLATKGGAVKL